MWDYSFFDGYGFANPYVFATEYNRYGNRYGRPYGSGHGYQYPYRKFRSPYRFRHNKKYYRWWEYK